MKIFLKSSDARALDFAVSLVLSKARGVAVPLSAIVSTAPNGDVLSHVSRRLIHLSDPSADEMAALTKITLPSTVEIQIS